MSGPTRPGPAVANTAEIVFYASIRGPVCWISTGYWATAAVLAWVAYEMDQTDRW